MASIKASSDFWWNMALTLQHIMQSENWTKHTPASMQNSLVRRKSKDICERNQNYKSRIAEEKTWIFIMNCWKKQEKKLGTYGFSEKMLR
jgi:hypothetical protein